jgi:hypothetical protein
VSLSVSLEFYSEHHIWAILIRCSLDYPERSPSLLKPVLVLSKFPGDSSFQTTPLEAYHNATDEEAASAPPWSSKSDHRVFWRGSSTGGFNAERDWRDSHRLRLHLAVNGDKTDGSVGGKTRDVLMPDGPTGYKVVSRSNADLAKAYTDVKLVGPPVQASYPANKLTSSANRRNCVRRL